MIYTLFPSSETAVLYSKPSSHQLLLQPLCLEVLLFDCLCVDEKQQLKHFSFTQPWSPLLSPSKGAWSPACFFLFVCCQCSWKMSWHQDTTSLNLLWHINMLNQEKKQCGCFFCLSASVYERKVFQCAPHLVLFLSWMQINCRITNKDRLLLCLPPPCDF